MPPTSAWSGVCGGAVLLNVRHGDLIRRPLRAKHKVFGDGRRKIAIPAVKGIAEPPDVRRGRDGLAVGNGVDAVDLAAQAVRPEDDVTIGQVKIGRLQLQLGRAARHPGKQLRDASLAPGQILPAVGRPAETPAVDVAARGNGRDLHDVIPRQIFADVVAEADLVELLIINDVDQIGLRLVEHIRAARHAGGLGVRVVGNGR